MKTITSLLTGSLLAITLLFSSQLLASSNRTAEEQALPRHPVTLTLHESNDGATVTLPKNALVEVILPSNEGSTGYSWNFALSNPEILEFSTLKKINPFIRSNTCFIGGITPHIWNFKTVSAGQTTVTFSLRRPWEKDTAPAKEVQFTIIVE